MTLGIVWTLPSAKVKRLQVGSVTSVASDSTFTPLNAKAIRAVVTKALLLLATSSATTGSASGAREIDLRLA